MAHGQSKPPVKLTEVKSEPQKPAERTQREQDNEPSPVSATRPKNRTGLWISAIAGVLALYWVAAVAAYLWGFYGPNLVEQSATFWGLAILSLVLPVLFIWLVSLIVKRSYDLKREALHLSKIALRLTHPSEQATREVTRLGHAVRRQVEAMETELDAALAKVADLESTVRSQTNVLNKTTEATRTRIADMRATLESERQNLEQLSQDIATQGQTLEKAMGDKARALTASSAEAAAKLDRADVKLQARLEALEEVASKAVERAEKVSTDLEEKTQKLSSVSDAALTHAESAGDHYAKHYETLSKTAHLMAEESRTLETKTQDHQDTLSSLAAKVAEKTQAIEALISKSSSSIDGALDSATHRIDEVTEKFGTHAKTIVSSGKEAADALLDASETALTISEGARTALQENANQIKEEITSTTEALNKDAQELISTTSNAARDAAYSARSILSESAEQIKKDISDTAAALGEQASQALSTASSKAKEATETACAVLQTNANYIKDEIAATSAAVGEEAEKALSAASDTAHEATEKARTALKTSADEIKQDVAASTKALREEAESALTHASQTAKQATEATRSALKASAEDTKTQVDSAVTALSVAMSKLSEENGRMKTAFEAQESFLNQVPDLVSEQSKKVEDLVALSASTLKNMVDNVASHAAIIEDGLDQRTKDLHETGTDVLDELTENLNAIQKKAEETKGALSSRAQSIISDINRASMSADKAIEQAQKALDERAQALRTFVTQSEDATEAASKEIQEKLQGHLGDIGEQIGQSSEIIEGAVGKLVDSSLRIQDATKNANQTLEQSVKHMEAQLAQFPDQAKESAERIRNIVLTQISSLTDISEQAAGRVLNLDAAFQARIKDIYDTLERLLPRQSLDPALSQGTTPLPAPDANPLKELAEQSQSQKPALPPKHAEESIASPEPTPVPGDQELTTETGLAKRLARRLGRTGGNKSASTDSPSPADQTLPSDDQADGSSDKTPMPQTTDTQKSGPQIQIKPTKIKSGTPGAAQKMTWRDILSAADAEDEDAILSLGAPSPDASTEVSRTSVHMIETLQAITLDLNRSLESDPQVDLVRRYIDGDRDLFAKRLADLRTDDFIKTIQDKHKKNAEFRGYVDRFVTQFDELISTLDAEDPSKKTATAQRQTDIGKVYAMLKAAIGSR